MFRATRVIACVFALVFAAAAHAEPFSKRIDGHQVDIERDASGEESLRVGGKLMHRNFIITIESVETIAGHETAIGTSSNGGNACDGSPFVLSFPGGKPRLDGPLNSCKTVSHKTESDRIRFESIALEGDDGEAWVWTPERGFKRAGIVKHAADPARGWRNIKGDMHPSELLDLGEVAPVLLRLLGRERKAVLLLINGVGSGAMEGRLYVGTGCRPHACLDAGAIVIADPEHHQLYVAWKLERRAVVRRSTARIWPPAARAAFDKWRRNG